MKDIWQESGMTIVIPPSGQQGEDLFTVAQLWTDLKLLSPSVWVRNLSAVKSDQRPPRQAATVLGNSRSGSSRAVEVDLFQQLSRQSLFTVRLIVVRNAVPGLEHDELQEQLVELVSKYIELSLPMLASGQEDSDAKTNLIKLNLLTTTTEHVSPHGNKLVGPQFHANFVASTEDRSAPLAGDAFVHFEEESLRFAGYTLMHVATLGALWSGLPQGIYELVKPEVWSGNKAYVARIFMSAILTDGLARRAASRVLQRAANPADGFTDLSAEIAIEGTYPIPESDTDAFIDYMADQTFTFDREILRYKPAIADRMPAKYEFSFWGQLKDFLAFSLDKLISIPGHAAIWVWRKIVRLVNLIFQGGSKGSAAIREPIEKLDRRDVVLQEMRQRISETKNRADETLQSPITPSRVRSTPDLWVSIRKLVFGMLDGSNLKNFGFQKSENGWPIFYKASTLFHDPAKKLKVVDPEDPEKFIELSWGNLMDASSASQAIFSKNRKLQEEIQHNLADLVDLQLKLKAAEAFLQTNGGGPNAKAATEVEAN